VPSVYQDAVQVRFIIRAARLIGASRLRIAQEYHFVEYHQGVFCRRALPEDRSFLEGPGSVDFEARLSQRFDFSFISCGTPCFSPGH
jgi:hypothetical protein